MGGTSRSGQSDRTMWHVSTADRPIKEMPSMSKLIALAAVIGAVLIPAAANAATTTKVSGVVVAKDTPRHSLVVASLHGVLTTVRGTARQLRPLKLGSRISAVGTALADGSIHATSLKPSGSAKTAH